MALLQLAESGYNHLAESDTTMSKYIFIPAGMFDQNEDTYVREDFFDSLSDAEFQEVMVALAPYQNVGMSAVGVAVAAGAKAIAPIVKKAAANRAVRVASGQAKPIFKDASKLASLKDKVSGAINKLKNQVTKAGDQEKKIPVDISGDIAGTTFDITSGQPAAVPFFTKYKTPLLVVGGLGAAFLLYKAFVKK